MHRISNSLNLLKSNGVTPLHIATSYDKSNIVFILISKGANVNLKNE